MARRSRRRKRLAESFAASPHDDYLRYGYVHDIYDGDTVYFHVDLGYNVWLSFQTGRLMDVDAPELRPLVSREKGVAARDHLALLLAAHALNRDDEQSLRLGFKLGIQTYKAPSRWFKGLYVPRKGKYGRWLIRLLGTDDTGTLVDINARMIRDGFARPYG